MGEYYDRNMFKDVGYKCEKDLKSLLNELM